jgi:rhamnulokinase
MTPGGGTRGLPATPSSLLVEMLGAARRFGEDVEFSRAGGGNASAKADGVLYIKPSGIPLAGLTADVLVPLDMAPLLALIEAGQELGEPGSDPVMLVARQARLAEAGGRRPSVELLFHALLPEPIVLHTHPVVLNALTCSREGGSLAATLFGDRVLWIPYTNPGLPLARAIAAARGAFEARTGAPAPHITLMQNHGIIVAGDTAAEIDERTGWITGIVRAELERQAPVDAGPERLEPHRARALVDAIGPALRGLLATGPHLKVVTFDDSELAAGFAASAAGRAFVVDGPLTPDQIVYTGSWPLLFDAVADLDPEAVLPALRTSLEARVAATGVAPIIVVVPQLGLFAAGDSWAQADTARHIYLDALRVGRDATRLGGVRVLRDGERAFIEGWEAEAYRRTVAARVAGSGRAPARSRS